MDKIKQTIVAWIDSMLGGFDTTIGDSVGILTLNLQSDPIMGKVYDVGVKISQNYITPVAVNIIAIIFLIEFIQLILKTEILKFEFLFKVILKFLIVKYVLDLSFDMLVEIYRAGTGIITNIIDGGNSGAGIEFGTKLKDQIHEITDKMTWYETLALMGTMAISFLAMFVTSIVVKVMAYVRAGELILFMTLSPIPCAFFGLGNTHTAKNFVFSFAGTVLQGVVMLISILFYGAICDGAMSKLLDDLKDKPTDDIIHRFANLGDLSFMMLLGAIILIMMIVKSGSTAKELFRS